MRFNGFIGMLLFAMAVAAGAQSTHNAVRSLSLQQCIDLALEHNLELQIERYSPEIARFTLPRDLPPPTSFFVSEGLRVAYTAHGTKIAATDLSR